MAIKYGPQLKGWIKMRCRMILLLLTVSAFSLKAEVFSIWPFGKGNAGAVPFNEHGSDFPSKNFWKENIRINGTPLQLDIALVDLSIEDAKAVLIRRYPDARYAAGQGSILMNVPQKDGSILRLWLISLRGVNPVLLFSMNLPADRKETPLSDWPKTIPLLPGAEARTVMQFPKRGADFASFVLKGATRSQTIHEMTQRLQSSGWLPASEEIADPFRSSGEVFYRENPLQLLLLGVSEPSAEGVMVSVYTRPLEKKK